jgi:DMSO/TMAO reductase YedYZ molybdopterin-dependent catalytic subunit
MALLTRRRALIGVGGAGLTLAGCNRLTQADRLTQAASFQHVLAYAQAWTRSTQRLLLSGGQMAREYRPSDISDKFFANGTTRPGGDAYTQATADSFADWKFTVTGLVRKPLILSLADLRKLPARTQITRHDCVEGWSAIGQWTGVQLGLLLRAAGATPQARYVVFTCADNLDGEPAKGGDQAPGQYYESLGMADATHPQTLIAYAMNGAPLPVPHGAPLRLRVERQLGYKHAKYLTGVQVVDSFAGFNGGKGGYWEDRGYEWYAGI